MNHPQKHKAPPDASASNTMRIQVADVDIECIREAAVVLEAVGSSGVDLPSCWRWPLADELHGIAATLAAAGPNAEEVSPAPDQDAQLADLRHRLVAWILIGCLFVFGCVMPLFWWLLFPATTPGP